MLKNKKCGITTGSCAAAATYAAAKNLLGGDEKKSVLLTLPGGKDVDILIRSLEKGDNYSIACVKKYSGDDPDTTNGILVYAKVSRCEENIY